MCFSPDFLRKELIPDVADICDLLHSNGIEEHIIANHTDASETLAPKSVGGNQEPWEFKRKVGNRIACIGGVNQYSTLTSGSKGRY